MAGNVPHGLAVRRDGHDILTGNARVGENRDGCIGQPVSEIEVEPAVLLRRRAGERGGQSFSLGGVVGELTECDQFRAQICFEADDGGGNAVERGAGHEADNHTGCGM
jgi:hypothetical protein